MISLHNVLTNQPVPFERICWSVFKKFSRWEDFLSKIKHLTLSSNPWLRILTEWLHQFWEIRKKKQEFHVSQLPNSSITKEEEMVNWEWNYFNFLHPAKASSVQFCLHRRAINFRPGFCLPLVEMQDIWHNDTKCLELILVQLYKTCFELIVIGESHIWVHET